MQYKPKKLSIYLQVSTDFADKNCYYRIRGGQAYERRFGKAWTNDKKW